MQHCIIVWHFAISSSIRIMHPCQQPHYLLLVYSKESKEIQSTGLEVKWLWFWCLMNTIFFKWSWRGKVIRQLSDLWIGILGRWSPVIGRGWQRLAEVGRHNRKDSPPPLPSLWCPSPSLMFIKIPQRNGIFPTFSSSVLNFKLTQPCLHILKHPN